MRKGVLRVAIAALCAIASLPFAPAPALAAACGTPGLPTRTVYLPNITKTLGGPAGWVTPFIVQNVGVASTDLEVSFYRFSDGALVTCRRVVALQPYRSFADYPNADVDLPGDSQFAVVVRSFGADVIAVVNEHQGAGAAAEALSYVGLVTGAQTLSLPYVAKFVNGWLVTFVMQNLGAAPANVTARFVSFDGTKTATLTRLIAPGASRFVNPVAEPALAAGTEYAVTLTSDQPIAAIANAHNDAPGAVAPMGFSYNAIVVAAPDTMYVPSVMRNADGGRSTRLVVQNAGTSDAAPSLLFRRGTLTNTVIAPSTLPAGRSWSYDPASLADGEWSLTVTGGQFAVLAIATAPTSALGFIGQAAPGNRAYLPNVTRTLGGADGWTTPIVLQSAGATSASLRWYRFADGVLMTRQLVTGLASGASVRIDPRAVPGLADDTQYAVVVDAQGGNVAAIVIELSFSGGDGAMSYEGVRAAVNPNPVATVLTASAPKTSVYTGARVQATAALRDQFDNAMDLPVAWSVAPSTIGLISPTGLFSAREGATGVANVTATVGSLSSTVAIAITDRPRAQIGGISFAFEGTGRADVYTETTITGVDASTVAAQVDLDVLAVQTDYTRAYDGRPRLYVLGTTATYADALQAIAGYSASYAQQIATNTAGLFTPVPGAILIDWSKIRGDEPLSTPRHELTHMMESQIGGALTPMPAWFNEGNARLEEFTELGSGYLSMAATYGAASMAATGTLFTLAELTSQTQWNLRSGLAGDYQYHAATQAVRQLRARVGMVGVIRILDLMNASASFEEAYGFVAGEPFEMFAAAYAGRARAVAPSYPGIATSQDTIAGPGLSIMFYGFPPRSTVTYNVAGAGSRGNNTVVVSQYGTYLTYLGSDWPAATYTITATWSGGSVTATGVKP